MSSEEVMGVAPSLIKSFVPACCSSKMLPGMTPTSRLFSRAKRAVIREPDFRAAWIMRVAGHSPAIMRFLAGKRCRAGGVPGGYSDMRAPPALIIS